MRFLARIDHHDRFRIRALDHVIQLRFGKLLDTGHADAIKSLLIDTVECGEVGGGSNSARFDRVENHGRPFLVFQFLRFGDRRVTARSD
ncbi:hypothetical protein [Xanthomonas vasicola]|uniref:hypothetical protein n=1 Tax=Xanthomonas vasicola TaxID=56459 RepID=UPI001FCA45A8|nr:hypothetical protein [Xanthomonas vasicola]